MMTAASQNSPALSGIVRAPGDKSISHRSMIFGAMAEGVTTVTGLLEGADIMSTAGAMRAFGADITRGEDGTWFVKGCGAAGFQTPKGDVDCGNAGTGVRLIMGAASAYNVSARYIGDASLSSRPMGRVLNPLTEMGAKAASEEGGRLPVIVTSNGELTAIDYTPPHASAQVKSAILLAGLGAKGTTIVRETTLTRDHTENMLRAFGAHVESTPEGEGQIVSLEGGQSLTATSVDVPGDPSSAAFLIVAALIVPGSDVTIRHVMMNPTRTGLFDTLSEMGGDIKMSNHQNSGGEQVADIRVKYSPLVGVTVPLSRAPSMIDEYPILAVAAAFASGETVMDGIGELRVKESDRIAATEALLKNNGVQVTSHAEGMTVTGTPIKGGNAQVPGGGSVVTHHDHRIAMSGLILGLAAQNPVSIDDASMVATSFPSFFDLMTSLGAIIKAA
ncbi:MAG: 3-phosphoshikimate 1-carboxyvinyltransferase [Maricaulaceae bacterium]